MDYIEGWFGRVFYTDKEVKLHVSGLKNECKRSPPSLSDLSPICSDLITEFTNNGFCVVEDCVSKENITVARNYINDNYYAWLKESKRQDDWRCHLMTDLRNENEPVEHSETLQLLLQSPELIKIIGNLTKSTISGIFYSQIALRTPLPPKMIKPVALDYSPGAEYHLDGQANSSGTRFPDPWTILVGIALVDIDTEDMGNFTVFPGWHIRRDWSQYPEEKRTKTLPNLGEPTHVCLKAGDAVVAHVLLPHRGGKNTSGSEPSAGSSPTKATHWNIPPNTREMVFFRVRVASIDYEAPSRGAALLSNVWSEFPGISHPPSISLDAALS